MTTLTAKQNQAGIDKAIEDHFINGVDVETTASLLHDAFGEPCIGSEARILAHGKRLGFILSAEQVMAKVKASLKGKDKPASYFGLMDLVNELDVPQMEFKSLVELAQETLGTKLKPSTKTKGFFSNSKDGLVAEWVRDHPDFKAEELYKAHPLKDASGGKDSHLHYDEFVSHQEFWSQIEKAKNAK